MPDPVDPGSYVEYHICIPNAWQYRSALVGAISELCKYWNWAHTENDIEAAQQAAFLFKDALTGASYEEACMTFCERLIECLTNDTDVQAAIANLIATNETVQDAIRDFVINDPAINGFVTDIARTSVITPEEQTTNLLKPDECNFDYTFNEATVLVNLLDSLTQQVFQAIEIGTNVLERAEKLLSALPVVGAVIPFDEILGLGNDMVENVKEDYDNKYDDVLYDDIRCDLWCLFKDDCELSILRAALYYGEKAGVALPADPIQALQASLNFLIAGDLPGDSSVYVMHMFILTLIQAGQDVLGTDFAQLGVRIVAAGDDPNNDWEVICDECVETWSRTWAFDIGEIEGWESSVGDYTPGVGFQSDGAGPYPYTIDIGRDVTWPAGSAMTRIFIGATSTTAETGAFRGVYYPGTAFPAQTGYTGDTGNYTMLFDANNGQPPRVQIQNSNVFAPGTNTLRFVTLQGTGPEPDWDA